MRNSQVLKANGEYDTFFLFREMQFSFYNNTKKFYILWKKLKSQFQRSVITEISNCENRR